MFNAASRAIDFPTLGEMTYLNSAAEGIPPVAVRESLIEYFNDHQRGMDGRDAHFRALKEVHELIGEFYGLSPDEIGFCACSSEAYNLASIALKLQADQEVIINDLDFPAGATPWLLTANRDQVKLWKSRNGVLDFEDLKKLLSRRTRLVSVSLVSFLNGFKISVPELVRVVRQHSQALVSVDVTQALGRIPLELNDVDLIVSSTHKWILATHGGGLVGVPRARANDWHVQVGGWFNLEDPFGSNRFEQCQSKPGAAGFAVGMPNFPAVYTVRAALRYIKSIGVDSIAKHADPLVKSCLEGLNQLGVNVISPSDLASLAGILAFTHPNAEEIQRHLRSQNVHVMCSAGRIRIALHGYNTHEDVAKLLRELEVALKK